jgi:hypothetical protein
LVVVTETRLVNNGGANKQRWALPNEDYSSLWENEHLFSLGFDSIQFNSIRFNLRVGIYSQGVAIAPD